MSATDSSSLSIELRRPPLLYVAVALAWALLLGSLRATPLPIALEAGFVALALWITLRDLRRWRGLSAIEWRGGRWWLTCDGKAGQYRLHRHALLSARLSIVSFVPCAGGRRRAVVILPGSCGRDAHRRLRYRVMRELEAVNDARVSPLGWLMGRVAPRRRDPGRKN